MTIFKSALVALLLVGAQSSWAQSMAVTSTQTSSVAKPWEHGVSLEDRQVALRLYREGNGLLKRALFAEALVKYRAALLRWDHPRIHYHIALSLTQLGDDPVVTHESVQRALRYEGAALKPDQLERARDFKLLLRRQLVELEVRSEQPGVEIKVDGKPLVTGPGRAQRLIAPGEHQVTASKRGYLTVNRSLLLLPGQTKRATVQLFTLEDVSQEQRRWATWKPWAAVGAGALAVIASGVLHGLARRDIQGFDDKLLERCPEGCRDEALEAELERGQLMQSMALGGYAVGGATLITGLLLAYLNRPRVVRIDRSAETFRVSLAPTFSDQSLGVVAGLGF